MFGEVRCGEQVSLCVVDSWHYHCKVMREKEETVLDGICFPSK